MQATNLGWTLRSFFPAPKMDVCSSWPLSHVWIGGTDHLAYYRLPGWFREACLLPEGQQHQAKSNCITPLTLPLPPLSPVSASLQLPSVCWISHTKTQPWGIWTSAPASLSDCTGLHITSRCILVIDFLISLCTLLHLLCTHTTEWKSYKK